MFAARTAIVMALLVPALSTVACGADDRAPLSATPGPSAPPAVPTSLPTSPRTPAGSPDPQPSVLDALTACMRDRGVKIPGTFQEWTPPPGYDPAKAQAAFRECLAVLDSGASGPPK
ncbi:hypothetical protein [Thermomonospora umbrina]|uniref:Lipoprotein n=1 Tax=Thermomonospora umbrina TaxID=111806 RepID=A0A3D9SVS6_9ACTN|nr:hypothetical protein [Thermomonospora umbrina]REE99918.1 hypothetical protein DFJ69_5435 [Thermomonospora umbrina]